MHPFGHKRFGIRVVRGRGSRRGAPGLGLSSLALERRQAISVGLLGLGQLGLVAGKVEGFDLSGEGVELNEGVGLLLLGRLHPACRRGPAQLQPFERGRTRVCLQDHFALQMISPEQNPEHASLLLGQRAAHDGHPGPRLAERSLGDGERVGHAAAFAMSGEGDHGRSITI